ncbi:hypothetical protein Ais01nite_07120 [Asanoa ishikariensis]|uniref:Uncharacterized protein n=1 Tax=Asanoa ishikariensis TaxID=137265 RepID=A0A1H3TF84_9ACTN|nr:hypothetical protein [Asanoa ishikariensis]GIF62677.1 hypothetical protein Ais01nite_07120 [Asanoa ishikariensis]SDZ48009.1 hypothetical protein SAMN05421684_5524 [Asanoa ishikariensis]
MRPVLIAEVALPPVGRISHVAGVGWMVAHPAESSVTVLDADLHVATRYLPDRIADEIPGPLDLW